MAEPPSSPTNRLKFLCSYGGRILPRPSDGSLRYVGGETRVLSVPRSISFAELKEKIAGMFNAVLVVKYQLMAEDLDALVSVKNDEDLCYMVEEYDRLERRPRSPTAASSPLFRLFLFPSPAAVDVAAPVEQRYVDALNGGVPTLDPPPHHQFFAVSSGGNSPTSTEPFLLRSNSGRGVAGAGMHRVRSTPNLDGGGNGGTPTGSPRAYKRPTSTFGNGGGSGWRIGNGGGGGCGGVLRKEVGYGCGCSCGCACCPAQLVRKYVCASPLGEGSPPGRGNQGVKLAPPPPPPPPPGVAATLGVVLE